MTEFWPATVSKLHSAQLLRDLYDGEMVLGR